MPSNVTSQATHLSDINELATGYFLCKEKWWSHEAEQHFKTKTRLIKEHYRDAIVTQVERGRAMAQVLRLHLVQHFPSQRLLALHWVARGALSTLVPGASEGHPADLVVELPAGFLGISCKSRGGSDGSGLKNPGLSAVSEVLGIDLLRNVTEAVTIAVREFRLPESQKDRKQYLRDHPELRQVTQARGAEVLAGIRDTVLLNLPSEKIHEFLVRHCLDCAQGTFPKYVRVVGRGDVKVGFSAELHDPFARNYPGPFRLQAVGRDGVGFLSNGARVCLLRAKWESEKLASTLKFSVDHWA